jgi:hypothetical protein
MNTTAALAKEISTRYADPVAVAHRLIARIDEALPAPTQAEPTKAQMIAAARAKSTARRITTRR